MHSTWKIFSSARKLNCMYAAGSKNVTLFFSVLFRYSIREEK